jgi:hypothetical protein
MTGRRVMNRPRELRPVVLVAAGLRDVAPTKDHKEEDKSTGASGGGPGAALTGPGSACPVALELEGERLLGHL